MSSLPSESGPEARAVPLEIHIDRQACRAAGECVLRAPARFAVGDDHKAQLIPGSDGDSKSVIAAARSCPNFAISVLRDGRELA